MDEIMIDHEKLSNVQTAAELNAAYDEMGQGMEEDEESIPPSEELNHIVSNLLSAQEERERAAEVKKFLDEGLPDKADIILSDHESQLASEVQKILEEKEAKSPSLIKSLVDKLTKNE